MAKQVEHQATVFGSWKENLQQAWDSTDLIKGEMSHQVRLLIRGYVGMAWAAIEESHDDLVAALEAVEWQSGERFDTYCASCRELTHTPDCQLDAALGPWRKERAG